MSKATALFLTDAQLAERLGISLDLLKTALPALEKAGFPEQDPLFDRRRYWPACHAFLDRRYGLGSQLPQGNFAPDGEERWK